MVAQRGAAVTSVAAPTASPSGSSLAPSTSSSAGGSTASVSSSLSAAECLPNGTAPEGAVAAKDVALKVIPKKKVKGNEASVWGEMEVLKGLDHPNIVRLTPIRCLLHQ